MATATLLAVMSALGTAGQNQPVYAGTIIFGIVGLSLAYLAFVSEEMDSDIQLKLISVFLLLLAVLSAFWPMRPWPH